MILNNSNKEMYKLSKSGYLSKTAYLLFFILLLNSSAHTKINHADITRTAIKSHLDKLQGKLINVKALSHQELNYDLQLIEPALLSEKVSNYQQGLVKEQLEISEREKKKRFNTGDTLISLVIPGSFLYASYRVYEHKNASKLLKSINNDISDLSADLSYLSMQIDYNSTLLAWSEQTGSKSGYRVLSF